MMISNVEFINKALETRKHRNKQRVQKLEQARIHSAFLDPIANEDRLRKEYDFKIQEDLYSDLVGRFQRGDHIFRDEAKEQKQDLRGEEILWKSAANTFSASTDLSRMSSVPTEEESILLREFKSPTKSRTDRYEAAHQIKLEAQQLAYRITDLEREAESIIKEVQIKKSQLGFDWQIVKQQRYNEIRKCLTEDKQKYAVLSQRVKVTVKDINDHFPEMSSDITVEEDIAHSAALQLEVPSQEYVYGWAIGRLSSEGEILNIIFGQFTKDHFPPESSWMYVGHNVDVHRPSKVNDNGSAEMSSTGSLESKGSQSTQQLSSARSTAASLSKTSRSETRGSGTTEEDDGSASEGMSLHSTSGILSVTEDIVEELRSCKPAVVSMQPLNLSTSATQAVEAKEGGPADAVAKGAYRISGCSIPQLNGRYLAYGFNANATKYRNAQGWVLFRVGLQEIPALGIFAENCYAALEGGDKMSDILDKKAATANAEIVSPKSKIEAGSVQFQRRYAAMTRVSVRAITADQTLHKIFTEDLRAYVRSESDRAMLMMLQALMESSTSQQSAGSISDSSTIASSTQLQEDDENQQEQVLPQASFLSTIREEGESASDEFELEQKSVNEQSSLGWSGTRDQEEGGGFTDGSISIDSSAQAVKESQSKTSKGNQADEKSLRSAGSKAATKTSLLSKESSSRASKISSILHPTKKTKKPSEGESRGSSRPGTSPKKGGAGAGTTSTGAQPLGFSNNKIVSGVDFEVKVTMSHNIEYQVGSQGFPLGKGKTYKSSESELSAEVIKRIEEREKALFDLRIESEMVLRRYFEQEVVAVKMTEEEVLGTLMERFDSIRESTLKLSDALGAWMRACNLEKERHKKPTQANYLSLDKSGEKGKRQFCVMIAKRGMLLYDRSEPVNSISKMSRRGQQSPRYATDVQFVGMYKTRDEAEAAFSKAMAAVPFEQVIFTESDNKMFVGLRTCHKHYLVRSHGVPPDLPCEQCEFKSLAQPRLLVPALVDGMEPAQQFIYKGQDYLEKIWGDLRFLSDNLAIRKLFPHFDFDANPLLLPHSTLKKIIGEVNVESTHKYLARLKSKIEEVKDARLAGTVDKRTLTGFELMGIAYDNSLTTGGGKTVDLDKASRAISADAHDPMRGLHYKPPRMSSSAGSPTAKGNSTMMVSDSYHNTSGGDWPVGGGSLSMTGFGQNNATSDTLAASNLTDSRVRFAESDFDKTTQRSTADRDGKSSSSSSKRSSSMTSSLQIDISRMQSEERLARALAVLGQSTTVSEKSLPDEAIPDVLRQTILERTRMRTLAQSKSAPAMVKLQAGAVPIGEKVNTLEGMRSATPKDSKTYAVEVRYAEEGAILSTQQVRPAVAHRVDDKWCRSDVGEWAGLTKGRSMRSFEFQENLLVEGRRKAEDRKQLQERIRAALDKDIINCDIPLIERLKEKAKLMKGSVLDLDVIQAEQYLTYRESIIFHTGKLQAIVRGNFGRKRAKMFREMARIKALRLRLTREFAVSASRDFVLPLVQRSVEAVVKTQSKPIFWCSTNMNGIPCVLSVYRLARFVHKSADLCSSCVFQKRPVPRIACASSVEAATATGGLSSKDGKLGLLSKNNKTSSFGSTGFRQLQRTSSKGSMSGAAGGGGGGMGVASQSRKQPAATAAAPPEESDSDELRRQFKRLAACGMCTCVQWQSTERWLLRCYDPVSCFRADKVVSIEDVRNAIMRLTATVKAFPLSVCQTSLRGESFGALTPLFDQSVATFDGNVHTSHSMATLLCKAEGSLLPVLPRSFTDALIDSINNGFLLRMEGELACSVGPKIVSKIHTPEASSPADWIWEPLANNFRAAERLKWAKDFRVLLQRRAEASWNVFQEKDQIKEALLRQPFEHLSMDCEDKRSLVLRTDMLLERAAKRIEDAMSFSKTKFQDFLSQEKQEQEEWGQAWDNIEDAGAWQGLNRHRYIERDLQEYTEQFLNSLQSWRTISGNVHAARDAAAAAFATHKLDLDDCIAFEGTLKSIAAASVSMKQVARELFRSAGATFTMPQKLRVTPFTSRIIQAVPYDLVFVRDPILRAEKPNRALWKGILRRSVVLRPPRRVAASDLVSIAFLRCVVEVFKDPVTGYFIVSIENTGSFVETEENGLHKDIQLSNRAFSDLTTTCKRHEIVLRPEDVATIFNHDPNRRVREKYERAAKLAVDNPNSPGGGSSGLRGASSVVSSNFKYRNFSLRRFEQEAAAAAAATSPAPAALAVDVAANGEGERDAMTTAAVSPEAVVATTGNAGGNVDADANPSVPILPNESNGLIQQSTIAADLDCDNLGAVVEKDDRVEVTITNEQETADKAGDDDEEAAPVAVKSKKKRRRPVLPSKLPRSVAYVTVTEYRNIETGGGKNNYRQRRLRRESEEKETAESLLRNLQLQIHTQRPSLGLLHFVRRMRHGHEMIGNTVWLQDLCLSHPAAWCNPVFRGLHEVATMPMKSTMQASLQHIELRLICEGKAFGLVVPMSAIIKRLAQQPVLLASFLGEIVVNQFSADSMKFVLNNVDMILPGEFHEQSAAKEPWLWRNAFTYEFKVARFMTDVQQAFRGPPYCSHRLMGGKYFSVRITVSANDDIKIVINRPIDGNFSAHCYRGDPVTVLLTRDEVRAFVVKAVTIPDLVPPYLLNSIEILHPDRREELYRVLLDAIFLPTEVVHSITDGPEEEDDESSAVLVKKKSEKRIIKAMKKFFLKFDAWALRTRGLVSPLGDEVFEVAKQSVTGVLETPKWSLQLQKDNQKNKLVEVRSGVWMPVDMENFYGKVTSTSVRDKKKARMRSLAGLPAKSLHDEHNSGSGDQMQLQSQWLVRILTDEAKDKFYVDLRPTDLESMTVQRFLAAKETELMASEDSTSHKTRLAEKIYAIHRQLAWQLSTMEKRLRPLAEKRRSLIEQKQTLVDLMAGLQVRANKFIEYAIAVSAARNMEDLILVREALVAQIAAEDASGSSRDVLLRLQDSSSNASPSSSSANIEATEVGEEALTDKDSAPAVQCAGLAQRALPYMAMNAMLCGTQLVRSAGISISSSVKTKRLPPKIRSAIDWMTSFSQSINQLQNKAFADTAQLSPNTLAVVIARSASSGLIRCPAKQSSRPPPSDLSSESAPAPPTSLPWTTAAYPPRHLTADQRINVHKYRDLLTWQRAPRPGITQRSLHVPHISIPCNNGATAVDDLGRPIQGRSRRIVRVGAEIYQLSDPLTGPFDIASVRVYNPANGNSWQLVLNSFDRWCDTLPGAAPHAANVDEVSDKKGNCLNDERSSSCIGGSEWLMSTDSRQHMATVVQCADRIVWTALSRGIVKAVEVAVTKDLETATQQHDEEIRKCAAVAGKLRAQLGDIKAIEAENVMPFAALASLAAAEVFVKRFDKQPGFEEWQGEKAVMTSAGTTTITTTTTMTSTTADSEKDMDDDLCSVSSFKSSAGGSQNSAGSSTIRPEPLLNLRCISAGDSLIEEQVDFDGSEPGVVGIRTFAVYIPVDEALSAVSIEFDALDLPNICEKFVMRGDAHHLQDDHLGLQSRVQDLAGYHRTHTSAGIIYSTYHHSDHYHVEHLKATSSKSVQSHGSKRSKRSKASKASVQGALVPEDLLPNPRVNRWLSEFQQNYGWPASEDERQAMQAKLEHEERIYHVHREHEHVHGHIRAHGESHHQPIVKRKHIYRGDVVIMVRGGDRERELFHQWLDDRYIEYGPIRELRRQREGKERQWRIENHAKYREKVLELSTAFVRGFEEMYSLDNSSSFGSVSQKPRKAWPSDAASPFQCRILLSKFHAIRQRDKEISGSVADKVSGKRSGRVLDEARLLDMAYVHADDEILLRFDTAPAVESWGDYVSLLKPEEKKPMKFSADIDLDDFEDGDDDAEGNEEEDELKPHVGQMVYAVYQAHCFDCSIPTNLCRFPGCGLIRTSARAYSDPRSQRPQGFQEAEVDEIQQLVEDSKKSHNHADVHQLDAGAEAAAGTSAIVVKSAIESAADPDTTVDATAPRGSGMHPIEVAIRTFLLYGEELFYNHKHLAWPEPTGFDPLTEMEMEREADELVEQTWKMNEYLRLKWQAVIEEAQQFRYVARRLVQPGVAQTLAYTDILKVRQGWDAALDEATMTSRKREECDDMIADLFSTPVEGSAASPELAQNSLSLVGSTEDTSNLYPSTSSVDDSSIEDQSVATELTEADDTELFMIPKQLALNLLGGMKGRDSKGGIVPHREIDPYPARKVGMDFVVNLKSKMCDLAQNVSEALVVARNDSEAAVIEAAADSEAAVIEAGAVVAATEANNQSAVNHRRHHHHHHQHNNPHNANKHEHIDEKPMTQTMFDWLMKQLSLVRPARLPYPASGDRGQFSSSSTNLKIDRLHCERLLALQCGSKVTAQFMYGVLLGGQALIGDDLSGAPHGAIRLCPAHLLPDLHAGLTVVVYDFRSNCTVACSLEGLALSRAAAALDIAQDDYPGLAVRLCSLADRVLRLSRVGSQCTAVTLDLNAVKTEEPVLYRRPVDTGVRHLGRRQAVAATSTSRRVSAAKKLLGSLR